MPLIFPIIIAMRANSTEKPIVNNEDKLEKEESATKTFSEDIMTQLDSFADIIVSVLLNNIKSITPYETSK